MFIKEDLTKRKIEKSFSFVNKNLEKRLVYGIVLEPEIKDAQGDIYDAEVIEVSAHNFLKDVRKMGVMHKQFGTNLHIVESYIAPVDFQLGDELVIKGSWVLVAKVLDEDVWEQVKNGELTGYSIGAILYFSEE